MSNGQRSELRGVSSGVRTLDERELAALRPATDRKPSRKASARPSIPANAGRLCPVCRQPFWDLDKFGQHVWGEARPYIEAVQKRRAWTREYRRRPEQRAKAQQQWERRAAQMPEAEKAQRRERERDRYRSWRQNATPEEIEARNANARARRSRQAAEAGRAVRPYGTGRLILALAGRPAGVRAAEVAERLGISQSAARTRLSKLSRAGQLDRTSHGVYRKASS